MLKNIFLFLFLSILTFSNSLEKNNEAYIASFNALRLGKGEKDYSHLAKSIEPFDIVGLVEVMNKKGLYKLLSEVEKISASKWGYEISPYPVGTAEYKEYYAFLYKKDKVKFIKSDGFYPDVN
ncbi:MAG: endonuclease/exonuclease/phosphatase family protein, partial [Cetobacterium sp.]